MIILTELTNPRLFATPIVTILITGVFIYLIIKILKKDINCLETRLLAISFVFGVAVGIAQLLYLYSTNTLFIIVINKVGIEALNLCSLFLFLSILVIYRNIESFFKNRLIMIVLISTFCAIFIHVLLPTGVYVNDVYEPYWSIEFGIYQIFFSQIIIASLIIISIKLYQNYLSEKVRNKFRIFIVGVFMLDIHIIWAFIANLMQNPMISLYGILFQACGVVGMFLIYSISESKI